MVGKTKSYWFLVGPVILSRYVQPQCLNPYQGVLKSRGPVLGRTIRVVVKIMVLFWGTLNIRCRIIIGTQKGTIILRTTHKKGYSTFEYIYMRGPKKSGAR